MQIAITQRSRPSILIVLLAALIVGAVACSNGDEEANPLSMVGSTAPALSGNDLTGAGVTDLADLAGKPTAVVFWLNTCPHCHEQLPEIEAAWSQLAADYNVLTVGMLHPDEAGEAGYETLAAAVETMGLTVPTVDGEFDALSSQWTFDSVPVVYVLDDELVIEDVLTGDNLADKIATSLEAVANNCCAVSQD